MCVCRAYNNKLFALDCEKYMHILKKYAFTKILKGNKDFLIFSDR